jgi:type IV pilus assembly protein PilV
MRTTGTRRRAVPTDAGFTMIEIMVSMLLLAIVMVGLSALQITAVRQVTSGRRAAEAVQLALSQVEQHQIIPFAVVNTMPKDAWGTLLKKDGTTQMAGVAVDGESQGPFTVERMVEVDAATNQLVVSIRVSWLDAMPGAKLTPTQSYRSLHVTMNLRRGI